MTTIWQRTRRLLNLLQRISVAASWLTCRRIRESQRLKFKRYSSDLILKRTWTPTRNKSFAIKFQRRSPEWTRSKKHCILSLRSSNFKITSRTLSKFSMPNWQAISEKSSRMIWFKKCPMQQVLQTYLTFKLLIQLLLLRAKTWPELLAWLSKHHEKEQTLIKNELPPTGQINSSLSSTPSLA